MGTFSSALSQTAFTAVEKQVISHKITALCFSFFDVGFELGEDLVAEIVFKAAGIFGCRSLVNTDADEPLGKDGMALIDALRLLFAVLGEGYIAILVNGDEAAAFQQSDRS